MSKSITINAFFKTLMSIVNIVFPLLTAPYVARVLSVDGYTEYNKALSMITWFSPFAVFGVYTYGMRTLSQIKNDKEKVSQLFTKLFIFSIITSLSVTFIYLLIVFAFPSFKEYRVVYLVIAIQLLFICFATDWANEAYESYGFILIKTFICRLLYVVAVFLFVKGPDDVYIYVLLSSISLAVNNIFTFVYARIKIKFAKVSIKSILRLCKPLFVVFLLVNSSMLYTILDRFVLTWFSNKLDLTYYTISQTIILAIVNVTSSLLLVSIPRLSFYWSNNRNEYHNLLEKTITTFMAFHTPCCIGVACISYEIMYLYSGMNYIGGYMTLLLFSIRYYFSAYDMILSKQVLLATGNEKVLTKVYYLGGIINIITKVILICSKNLSPELCVITTFISDIFVVVCQFYEIYKLKLGVKIINMAIIKYLLFSLLFILVTLIVKLLSIDSIIYRTMLIIFACSFLYIVLLFFTKDPILIGVKNKIIRRFQK